MTIRDDDDMIGTGVEPIEPNEIDALRARVAELERNFERELMCHAGCGVIAGCNTRESLTAATSGLHPDYHSASLQYCIDAAWREIYERERANKAEMGLAIMAVCGYFSRMRGPDCYKVFTEDGDYVYVDDGVPCCYPDPNITPLYAGSAPVPAVANHKEGR